MIIHTLAVPLLLASTAMTQQNAAPTQPAADAAATPTAVEQSAPTDKPKVTGPLATPPKLIVAISVDQFSADLFNAYRPHFKGGLARLASGVVFPSGFQSHAATETCPGHSTLLTGSRPSRTGIIANEWIELGHSREDKTIYCTEDSHVEGSSSRNYTVSNIQLMAPTLGERLKAVSPNSRVVAVSGKDRGAVMMAGKNADQTWWWNGKGFVTYVGHPNAAPATRINAMVAEQLAKPHGPMDLPAQCVQRSMAVKVGDRTVGTGRFEREAGNALLYRASPEMDAATFTLATDFFDEMKLGQGASTDVLIVSASATDYVGHGYGTEGAESCIQIDALDKTLGRFFEHLDASGVDYQVVLSADHGGHDTPERNAQHAIPEATRADEKLIARNMSKSVAKALRLGDAQLLWGGNFGDIYVDPKLKPALRQKVMAEAIKQYRAHPQVYAVYTSEEIMAQPSPRGAPESWTMLQRARASYYPGRSGDFIVALKPRITPITKPGVAVATHGSFWDYDRRVPILFWRKGITPFNQPNGVETVDILPTLAALIDLKIDPDTIDGRCLDLDPGPADTCSK